jgi:hypothetical protein
MPNVLDVTIEGVSGPEPRSLNVTRVYNLGFTIRDKEKQQAHIDEVDGVHVPWPPRLPIIFPIAAWATITSEDVPVQYATTSGEIEIVTVVDNGELFVGVGSDHTDRELEKTDIPWAKQVTPNVLAPTLWRWSEVKDHWDEVLLESTVDSGSGPVLYQQAGVKEFWTPQEMVDSVQDRIVHVPGVQVFYSGTVVSVNHKLDFGHVFRMRMIDPVLKREIDFTYRVTQLADEISE